MMPAELKDQIVSQLVGIGDGIYDAGFQAGLASAAPRDGDLLFTQAQVDQMLAEKADFVRTQVKSAMKDLVGLESDDLKAKVDAL